jgi:tetratricopeptide (TPR) repeat protein
VAASARFDAAAIVVLVAADLAKGTERGVFSRLLLDSRPMAMFSREDLFASAWSCCALLFAGQALANERGTVPRDAAAAQVSPVSELARAKNHFVEGQTAYRLGQFRQALAQYEAALKLDPRPHFNFNIAQCYRNMGDHRKALFHYRLYLSSWEQYKPGTAVPYGDEVLGHVKRLETRLAELERAGRGGANPDPTKTAGTLGQILIQGVPQGAQVWINGALRGEGPLVAALELSSGDHELRVHASGYLPWRRRVRIESGKVHRQAIDLLPLPKRSTLWLGLSIATTALTAGFLGMGIGLNVQHNNQVRDTEEWVRSGHASVAGYVLGGILAAGSAVAWWLYVRSGQTMTSAVATELRAGSVLGVVVPTRGGAVAAGQMRF